MERQISTCHRGGHFIATRRSRDRHREFSSTLASPEKTNIFQLRTERLITCKQSAPQWLNSLMGGTDTSHVFETSYVDPESKKVTMVSTNLTFSNILSVRETVVYRPLSSTRTQFVQDAKITALCGGWQKIKNAVEEASVARFSENARKGKEGFESVLAMSRRVFSEEKQKERSKQEMVAA